MKGFLVLLTLATTTAFADSFQSTIHSFDPAPIEGEPTLIKFTNGRVAFVRDGKLLEAMERALLQEREVETRVNEKNDLLAASTLDEVEASEDLESTTDDLTYSPTVLASYNDAYGVLSRMNRYHQRNSQCYNRAHVWAYEEYNRTGLKSMKLFLFFTNSYIRRYRFQWWFHVAPMVYAKAGESTTSYVVDRTFASTPLSVKNWTDKFIYSKRSCPSLDRYSEYENNQESEHCYVIPVSMYYWQPRDIDNHERTGYEKKDFISHEVNWAYREAF